MLRFLLFATTRVLAVVASAVVSARLTKETRGPFGAWAMQSAWLPRNPCHSAARVLARGPRIGHLLSTKLIEQPCTLCSIELRLDTSKKSCILIYTCMNVLLPRLASRLSCVDYTQQMWMHLNIQFCEYVTCGLHQDQLRELSTTDVDA